MPNVFDQFDEPSGNVFDQFDQVPTYVDVRDLAPRGISPETNQPYGVPTFVPPGVEGYDPKTGERSRFSKTDSAILGAADMATFGFGDEIGSAVQSAVTGRNRDEILADMRRNAKRAQYENPWSYAGGQVAGGIAQGVAAAPATLSAHAAGSALLPRMAAGAADGTIFAGAHGVGTGEDLADRGWQGLQEGGIGAIGGGILPVLGMGASRAYEAARNWFRARPIANAAGASPDALRALGGVLEADDALGPVGQANMARAGHEAMLVDAGPTAQRVLDTSIQRAGPGARVAREAVQGRVGRDALAMNNALDATLGAPQGITATRTAIRQNSSASRSSAYDDAYSTPIDYSDPRGMHIEQLVQGRVPASAIQRANALMRLEGNQSRQIMAQVADDGTVTFQTMPDVRQLDYITRGLNDLAEAGEGAGALGGINALGHGYQNLSREIRSTLRDLVPEYGQALETAADPIRRSKAVELGSSLLSPSMTRDMAAEAIHGMTQAERQALAQGVRSQIDDVMANVTRTVQDGDVPAREAIKVLRDLSSRANREKLSLAIGEEQADALFAELDRAATSFDLRASVANNSATYARNATEQRVNDMTEPGVFGTLGRGNPFPATKLAIRNITGMTDEALRARKDGVYSELSGLLTRRGGAGQGVYDAINDLRTTDQATREMQERIFRALVGPHLAYPAAIQAEKSSPMRVRR